MESYDEYLEEKVLVCADTEKDVTVTVNGVNYRIKRGSRVYLPRKAALVLENAAEQNEQAREFVEKLMQRE